MYINFDSTQFAKIASETFSQSKNWIFIVDNEDFLVNSISGEDWVPDFSNLKAILTGNHSVRIKDKIYFYYPVPKFDWKVVGVISTEELTAGNKSIFLASLLSFIVVFLISTILGFYISSGIVKPIKELTSTMQHVTEGNFKVKVDCKSQTEVGILSQKFNFMTERIQILFEEAIEKQVRIKNAEYRALQSQINSHFIFNTLNSIRWMAIVIDADNIKKVIDALSRLLKNSTNRTGSFIKIGEEVSNLEDYIYIQKLAYRNKFSIIWKMDKKIIDLYCEKFILQPVLENAIFHGIEPKVGFGSITISGKEKNGNVVFCIEDDGVGITKKEIERIQEGKEQKKGFCGIGIENVNQRLKSQFGKEYGISFESEYGKYTRAFITCPIIREVENV
jgi:two-component system sensor histidine kinase YesM